MYVRGEEPHFNVRLDLRLLDFRFLDLRVDFRLLYTHFPSLNAPKDPFLVVYPAFDKRLSFLARRDNFLDTILPCLLYFKSFFRNPPDVCLAVPCMT